jgi:hypothetical protein
MIVFHRGRHLFRNGMLSTQNSITQSTLCEEKEDEQLDQAVIMLLYFSRRLR